VSKTTQEFIRGLHNLRSQHHGSVVTIGSFDGVHLGHQAILRQVKDKAKELALPAVVMIFEPQPDEFFAGEKAPARLMRLKEKVQTLFKEGVERICCLPFNHALSQLTAEEFVERVLVEGLGTRYLVVGDDFCFGAGRTGNYDFLEAQGQRYDFTVTDTQSFLHEGERVSSTWIRRLLQQNEFVRAATLLGKPYTISGRVVKGNQLGRQLGAPTANVYLHRYRSPLSGVFAVHVDLNIGRPVRGIANVGVRPTLKGDERPLLEVHLFDRDDDLYGREIITEFKHKLRDEQCFENLGALKTQIQKDIAQAKTYFINDGYLQPL
jgi:riboflavin kinase/FMN adenylyltransferase